jgi:xanthine dehydrogenase accessory factor
VNENAYLAEIICDQLSNNSAVVLASILSIQGSSPRHSGSKMIVSANGKNYGTVGGSLLEATAIAESRKILNTHRSARMEFELNGKDVNSPGMICGGKAELFLDYIPANEENKAFFRAWQDAAKNGKVFYYLTHFKNRDKDVDILGRLLLFPDGRTIGVTRLKEEDIDFLKSSLHDISATAIIPLGDAEMIIDRIKKIKTLFCFGAGHVAQPTARIAAMVGFRVVIIDDRPEFANADRFPDASNIHVVKDLNNALENLDIDSDSFIVILTRGHLFDRVTLEHALKTSAGYIGMISSRKKRQAIYEALLAQGVEKSALERVHSPIGIPIGGETPEEIAVSIVAELISERCKQE